MNKSASKKNKVIKCPSNFAQENISDVTKEFILNDLSKSEHVNGIINGLTPTGKSNKKSKKNQKHEETCQILNSPPNCESNGIDKTPEKCDASSLEEKNIKEAIINVKHTKKKKTKQKIDGLTKEVDVDSGSNELTQNNSTEVEVAGNDVKLKQIIYEEALASCSKIDMAMPSLGNTNEILDVVQSLVSMRLDDSCKRIFESANDCGPSIQFMQYESELQMPMIMKIIQKDLSEPYSIYTYRYFIHNWPKLCFLAMCEDKCVGAIVCKLDTHRKVIKRGYIAMLAVDKDFRKQRIGSKLVEMAIEEMVRGDADEVVLETEVTNKPALQLYEKLGFVRDKRLFRYYLNGVDALRLKLWLR